MAVWAQSANAYRRYVPKNPTSRWPRTGASTIATSRCAFHTRRAPARASNIASLAPTPTPILVLAAILAGIRHGIANKLEPGPMAEGDSRWLRRPATADDLVQCARTLPTIRTSCAMRSARAFQDVYYSLKQTERMNFERIVTSLDHAWYAHVA